MTDRVALLVEDILGGPDALARLLAAYEAPDSPLGGLIPALPSRRRFVFTGLGSSRHAGSIAASELRAAGASAWVEYASTGAPTPPAADLVLVAVFASGRTPEVVAAARRHLGQSLVVAVTNDPASERRGGVVVPVPRGVVEGDPFRRAIVESVTAEFLAAELWRRAAAQEP